jgi:protein-disulfide isomerase
MAEKKKSSHKEVKEKKKSADSLAAALAESTKARETQMPSQNYSVDSESQYSFSSFLMFLSNNFVLLLVAVIFFMAGFFSGSMWQENQTLKNGVAAAPTAIPGEAAPGQPAPPSQAPEKVPAVTAEDHVRGSRTAKVQLVEYSDFNCGFCSRFHGTMKEVMAAYSDSDVAWVYRDMPILGSNKEAEASECAAKLGGETAYWSFTDGYFDSVGDDPSLRGNDEGLADLAVTAEVNRASFLKCLSSGETKAEVDADMAGGRAVGINGTPGTVIVVDGEGKEVIPGALPVTEVKKLIDKYL